MTQQVNRARLQSEWVLCAIAAAAARFVPVPVVDDLVRSRATRTAVSRTWTAHGRPYCPSAVGILAADSTTFWGGLARSAVRSPLKILLYPVRKIVRMVTAVRGVSTDLVGIVLLARSVDRCLTAGWFTDPDVAVLDQQARLVRRAHEQVIGTADLRMLTGTVGTALRQVGGLREQAVAFARRAFGRQDAGAGPTAAVPSTTPQETQVVAGVTQVVAVLDRPEVARVLADLDRRFDTALAALTGSPADRGTPAPSPRG